MDAVNIFGIDIYSFVALAFIHLRGSIPIGNRIHTLWKQTFHEILTLEHGSKDWDRFVNPMGGS